ncbi:MAG: ABC transporter ATP-binding protein [Stackebrandtia sp.]
MTETILTGAALTKRFGTTVALAGVDFSLGRGETVAIMGPSGSGKSTLLHCLAGIMRPDSGEVHLMDQRVDTMSESRRSRLRRTRFGFLFQFGQLLPELPADENTALPLMLDGAPKHDALRAARFWFSALGIGALLRRRPGELSGGQAQRVALARAQVTRPVVVFADEPTGALDQATGADMMRALVRATKGENASLVVVTHDAAVAAHCDRTIEIRDGLVSGASVPAPSGAVPAAAGHVPPPSPQPAEAPTGPDVSACKRPGAW